MWNNLINKNIHELRTQQGLTLQELADKVGTSKQTIQLIISILWDFSQSLKT